MTVELNDRQARFVEMILQNVVDETVNWQLCTDSPVEKQKCDRALAMCSAVNARIASARRAVKDALTETCVPARTLCREYLDE